MNEGIKKNVEKFKGMNPIMQVLVLCFFIIVAYFILKFVSKYWWLIILAGLSYIGYKIYKEFKK